MATSAKTDLLTRIKTHGVAREGAARLIALDWMRGLVMILMAIDHAAFAFNAGHLQSDSVVMYEPGTALPVGQFFTRWITHLCAPTFVFLAGVALALSTEKRLARGESAGDVDRHLLIRGLIILAVDPLWWSLLFPGRYTLQVMYAIGTSILCMIFLRRLSTKWLFGIGLGVLATGEALFGAAMALGGGPTVLAALTVGLGIFGDWLIAYPLLPWLAMMMLGWAFGSYLLRYQTRPEKLRSPELLMFVAGLISLGVFGVVRALNGYGNMLLYRDDNSLVQWLHVSKYPPSISFEALELGLMAVILAVFFRLHRTTVGTQPWMKPFTVFGQTALFFYLLHAHLLMGAAVVLGVRHQLGLGTTYLSTLAVLVVLYPLCRWYRGYKAAHKDSWVQYV